MRIVCVSDLHGYYTEDYLNKLPEGDVLVIAGDTLKNYSHFFDREVLCQRMEAMQLDAMLGGLNRYKKIFQIAGNHDWVFERDSFLRDEFKYITYLEDEHFDFEGVKFYGYPWTPTFFNWAFMRDRKSASLRHKVEAIHRDTDVLITHGPPHMILDKSEYNGKNAGCELLADKLKELYKLKLVVMGHIHGPFGVIKDKGVYFANSAQVDPSYDLTRVPHVIDI